MLNTHTPFYTYETRMWVGTIKDLYLKQWWDIFINFDTFDAIFIRWISLFHNCLAGARSTSLFHQKTSAVHKSWEHFHRISNVLSQLSTLLHDFKLTKKLIALLREQISLEAKNWIHYELISQKIKNFKNWRCEKLFTIIVGFFQDKSWNNRVVFPPNKAAIFPTPRWKKLLHLKYPSPLSWFTREGLEKFNHISQSL